MQCFEQLYENPPKVDALTFLQAACDEFRWFDSLGDKWMQNCGGATSDLVNDLPQPGCETFAWSGSQGIVAAAFSNLEGEQGDFSRVANPPDSKCLDDYVTKILDGMAHLFYQDVLCEAPFQANLQSNPIDLGTGKGVLLRFLSRLDSNQTQLFDKKITATAGAAWAAGKTAFQGISDIIPIRWATADAYGTFNQTFAAWWGGGCAYAEEWSDPNNLLFCITRQGSGLSALVAALRVP